MDSAEGIYEQIGQLVVDAIDDDWIEAKLVCKAGDDWIDLLFEYHVARDAEPRYVDLFDSEEIGDAIEAAFFKLRELYRRMPSGPWGTATLRLTSEGEFEIDYSYDEPE